MDARTAVGATGHGTLIGHLVLGLRPERKHDLRRRTASITEANVTNVGDARLRRRGRRATTTCWPSSPLVDAGRSRPPPQGLDLDGNPLVADGDDDGTARRDLGTFQLQPASSGQPQTGGSGAASGPAPDVTAPVLARLRLAAGRRPVARGARLSLARARRLRLLFVASEAATLKLVPRRVIDGRLSKARGSIVRSVAAGKGSIALGRRLRRLRMLRPGAAAGSLSPPQTAPATAPQNEC